MANAIIDRVLTISDSVQGVTEWKVERKVNAEEYTEIDPYDCPSAPVDESQVYAFAYQELITGLNIGDIVQWRFTPTGYDLGNGNAWESDEYTLTRASVGNRQHFTVGTFKVGSF
jgi:hypothetical protein